MLSAIEIFTELGSRLRRFGEDETSRNALREAISANEWFSEEDIKMAIDAICREMLDAEKLREWLSHYPTPSETRRVAIIMAGNLPLVGFFDLLCVLACGYTAIVKPSSKDNALMSYVVDLLRKIEPCIAIEKYVDASEFDMVIATGGDAAAKYFKGKFADKPALIRGSRHSVAVLSGKESQTQLEGLRRDIYSYNGLGCRNVSLLFIPKGWQGAIPKPQGVVKMRYDNYMCDKAMLTMTGVHFVDLDGALAIASCSLPEALSRIHYAEYGDLAEVEEWLSKEDEKIQCVVSQCVAHPRRVDFGEAQYPTLMDYADGVDVMKFLIA